MHSLAFSDIAHTVTLRYIYIYIYIVQSVFETVIVEQDSVFTERRQGVASLTFSMHAACVVCSILLHDKLLSYL